MAKLARLIFRLDFTKPLTAYINEPGTALDILHSKQPDFLNDLRESSNRTISGTFYAKNKIYREINFHPTNVNGTVEYLDGDTDFETIDKDSTFSGLGEISQKFFERFSIPDINRAGIRFFVVDDAPIFRTSALNDFIGRIDSDFVKTTSETLGEISDTAVVFEGKASDEISYRLQFGPLTEEDTQNRLFLKGQVDDPAIFTKKISM